MSKVIMRIVVVSNILSLPLQLVFPGDQPSFTFVHWKKTFQAGMGSRKCNGRKPKRGLILVFNIKLGCSCIECNFLVRKRAPRTRIENSTQLLSCLLKYDHVLGQRYETYQAQCHKKLQSYSAIYCTFSYTRNRGLK